MGCGADLGDQVAPGAGLDARDAVCEEGARHKEAALDQDEQGLARQQFGHASAQSQTQHQHAAWQWCERGSHCRCAWVGRRERAGSHLQDFPQPCVEDLGAHSTSLRCMRAA